MEMITRLLRNLRSLRNICFSIRLNYTKLLMNKQGEKLSKCFKRI